ncbi:uncharacterized protein LOC121377561 [Gigantopelta aegis]|uniref:uncharacterized protein LOC121377561 n=1 Tax=Gigantopelta aegis TaxID=1735272 RepID=UPI001B887C25|nr:uncharacterized protein LOC121377561 [Gigantopelta aegis]XP_041361542.1 uncharacterized protein LOC121377561 [Gigantopelta aegis]
MNRTKVLKGMSSSMRRSEYDDALLQNNARFDNRLNRDIRQVEKAKKVISRGYEKESQWLKQKLAASPAYTSRRGTFPFVTSLSARGHGVNRSAPFSRLVPDWDRAPPTTTTASPHNNHHHHGIDVLDESKSPREKNETSKTPALTNGHLDHKPPEIRLPENAEECSETSEDNEAETKVLKPRRHKVPDHFWENLSAPKHKSNVRVVRDRLEDEFKQTSTKSSVHKSKSSPAMSAVTKSKSARK